MLRAMNDRVIVRPDVALERTSSGNIIIPDTAKEGIVTRYGTVLSYGPKCDQVHEGMRVMYNRWHGLDCDYQGEVLLAIREDELLAEDVPEPAASSVTFERLGIADNS